MQNRKISVINRVIIIPLHGKKILYLGIALCLTQLQTHGQASNGQNYVITNTVKQAAITNADLVPGLTITTQGKSQTIAYFDGLGRPLQTVITQGSASKKDIVSGNEYDAFGRELKKYLPYADMNGGATPGSYKTGWTTPQAAFYNGQLTGVDADANPWSVSVLEASPLNRLLTQGAPGTTWQPNTAIPYDNSKKTIQIKYEVNIAADNVRRFDVDMSTGAINSPGFYGNGLLTVKQSIDEHQGITKEFTDKSGHLLLKQVYITGDILQTYYIYDDLDLLRAVIQPEGVAAIPASGTWSPDATFKARWMFQYNYDYRNRMIEKTVPGAATVYMVYDQWDRLVLTQDGNQRSGSSKYWLFTKYDALNRPIITGTIMDNRTAAIIQDDLLDETGRFETVNTGATEGYTLNNSFPSWSAYGSMILYTITHYDAYANLPSWSSNYNFVSENGVTSKNDNLQGQVVATQTRILNTSNWLRSVVYYDDKYRSIQSTADNSAGGKDRLTKVLSFDGKPLQEYQTRTSNVYTTALVVKKSYTYDHADRVLKITHKIGTGEEITLAENAYNEMGQLLNKKLHQSTTFTTPLQKLDYSYNIRGWLNGVNKPYSDVTGYEEGDLFNFELHYNTATMLGAEAQFNGNIAEQIWKGGYDEYLRAYGYTYDKANRMKNAMYSFKYQSTSGMEWDFHDKYDEFIKGYDRNGNISGLRRYHGPWILTDDLTFSNYDGNKLGRVDESAFGPAAGFTDQVNAGNGGNDYTYDANGNLTMDYNKWIHSISYNHLNLPISVEWESWVPGTIEYLYDAAGNKLQKTVTDKRISPNKITITKYAGAFVYTNSYLIGTTPPAETLELIGHEEGRIRPAKIDPNQPLTAANTKYIYDYFMKDHLGNTRMVLTTEQQTDLYAATQEPANATKENTLFNNLGSTIIAKPTAGAGFDNNASNTQVSKINGGAANTRVGPSIILKVMPGDVISISTKAWYTGATQAVPSGLDPIKDQLLSLLTGGIVSNNGTHGGIIPLTDVTDGGTAVLQDFLDNRTYDNGRPKAFLNWMIVDEEFKKVNSSFHMGAVQVPLIDNSSESAASLIGPTSMTVRRGGWLYVYLSNESNQDVYFDDLVINHKRGPVVEMNDYYPFGMNIVGLNSKAMAFGGEHSNRKKYNQGSELQSIEFTDGGGLETYDTHFRQLDPQLGRWWQIDPKPDMGESPYASMSNNPITKNDPLGDQADGGGDDPKKKKPGLVKTFFKAYTQTFKDAAKGITNTAKSLTKSNMVAGTRIAVGMAMGTPAGMKKWDAFGKSITNAANAPGNFVMKAPTMTGNEWASALGTGFGWATQVAITDGITRAVSEGGEVGGTLRTIEAEAEEATSNGTIIVTREGVALPRGAQIPANYVENKYRSSSYGVYENGKFVEKVRIDPATPVNMKGPNVSHFHLDGGDEHIFDNTRWFLQQ